VQFDYLQKGRGNIKYASQISKIENFSILEDKHEVDLPFIDDEGIK
jgi:hypothetical protein